MSTTIIENVVADGQWAERTVVHHGASESIVQADYARVELRAIAYDIDLPCLVKPIKIKGLS